MEMESKMASEIAILPLLNHPHIIRLYETQSDIFMVMDDVTNGQMSESEALKFFQLIICSIERIHFLRIADFGLSNKMKVCNCIAHDVSSCLVSVRFA